MLRRVFIGRRRRHSNSSLLEDAVQLTRLVRVAVCLLEVLVVVPGSALAPPDSMIARWKGTLGTLPP